MSMNLVKVLDRDLKLAKIAKRDERNRTVNVHSLRHTFATLMSRGGVAPRVAQAAMRHATLDLTMRVYTDPKLLDIAGALDMLPALPLDRPVAAVTVATGTDGGSESLHQRLHQLGTGAGTPRQLLTKSAARSIRETPSGAPNAGSGWYARQDSNLWPAASEAAALSS